MDRPPLPEILRPKRLSQFVGQKDLAGSTGILKKLLEGAKETGFMPSMIFWGPPGSGKTTLARIIATELKRKFYEFSAVNTSTKDVERVIATVKTEGQLNINADTKTPVVFIDEIHRFNKAQQDKLLPHVEKGRIIFIGATTENPSFEVISPLLSRCRVLVLDQLTQRNINTIVNRGLKEIKREIDTDAKKFLVESSNGDARVALVVLEISANLTSNRSLRIPHIEQALQRRQYTFDKKGEDYFNVISAFIKSMRASNVDASLYYLARMIEAGQDPLYIARRMVVFASEDVGMAQPTALVVANEVFRSCETIGYPECAINLAHGVVYLATAKKDRAVYTALHAAQQDVHKFGNLPIPMNLRNAPTKLMKSLGYGSGYDMYDKSSLLPEKLKNKKYYKNSS